MIAEVIAKAKGWDLAKVARYGRQGMTGERPKEQIGIHVIRAGDIIGEHTVIFGGSGETIELTHRVGSRDALARGALVAALFLSAKDKGLYTMADVLK
jgi:4-hydroxy-tetrahydrodipicolinate reductase